MTITEALETLDDFITKIRDENQDVYSTKSALCKTTTMIEMTYNDYLAILYLYTELKQIQETIVRLGWQKWERGE